MNRIPCLPLLVACLLLAIPATGDAQTDRTAADGSIAWREYNDALNESQVTGKPVMIHFTAHWCGWCKKMLREVYTDPAVASTLAREFIPVMIDTDKRPDLKGRYRVTGLPTIWFQDRDGRGITYVPGYVDAPVFLQILRWVASGAYREQTFDEYSSEGRQ